MDRPLSTVSDEIARTIVDRLFETMPNSNDRILYLGDIPSFIDAVDEYCEKHGCPHPEGVAVIPESDGLSELRQRYDSANLQFFQIDFLTADLGEFQYIVGYAPPLRRMEIGPDKRATYKEQFRAATGQFDPASLFFEHALSHLAEGGRLSFLLPERFQTSESDRPLRQWVASNYHVESLNEFQEADPIPLLGVTIINEPPGRTQAPTGEVHLPEDGSEWASILEGVRPPAESEITLGDVCLRVSTGVSTGADRAFMMPRDEVPPQLEEFAYPVIAGKHLAAYDEVNSSQVVICPYTQEGQIRTEQDLGDAFMTWAETHRDILETRSSLSPSQPWYAWAQPPPLDQILKPKILTRDFADEIRFWIDDSGEYIPRKSVFYIVPGTSPSLENLGEYLNRSEVREWLEAKSQGSSSRGFRLKVRDLNNIPLPPEFV